jgi:hypothetical protein
MLNSGKKNFALSATKKLNILTVVSSEKKILNETKNHTPLLQVKWSVPYILPLNIFLEKNHNTYLQVKWFVPKKWVDKITSLIPLYKGLTFLTFENLEKGKIHPLFKVNRHTVREC